MARIKNHLERMADHYINMAKKATSPKVREECMERAQMLRTMNYCRLVGESDADYHKRRVDDITGAMNHLQNTMKGRE